jgi:hypothetical protein
MCLAGADLLELSETPEVHQRNTQDALMCGWASGRAELMPCCASLPNGRSACQAMQATSRSPVAPWPTGKLVYNVAGRCFDPVDSPATTSLGDVRVHD